MKKRAVYPGSFDPITNGHIDILKRGLKIFNEIIILIGYNTLKQSLFTVEERIDLIKMSLGSIKNKVKIDSFSGLTINYLKQTNIQIILRGIRNTSDFNYEFQMAMLNKYLNQNIETVFFMTNHKWSYTNSHLIKEIVSNGGSIKGLIPKIVAKSLSEKIKNNNFIN